MKTEGTKEEKGKVKVGGQTPHNMNRKAGHRNRCNWRESEYHLLPKCPSRGASNRDSASAPPPPRSFNNPPESSVSMESPACVRE